MKPDYTHIAIILDRTGSMESIRDDIIGGFNAFLDEQKQLPGKPPSPWCSSTPRTPTRSSTASPRCRRCPRSRARPSCPVPPRRCLDAIGRGINDVERSLADIMENYRPSRSSSS